MTAPTVDQLRRFELPNWSSHARGFRYAAGLYRLRDAEGDLLYLGIGWDPALRLKMHAKKAAWWPEVDLDRSDVDWFRRYEDAAIAEKLAIRLEQPKYNMIYSLTRPHWSYERGATVREPHFADGDEITVFRVREKIPELVRAVRMHRRCVYITKRDTRAVAVVPLELAELARRAGGADRAAKILADHLRVR